MNTLFFYGTLRHVPLLGVVLGRSVAASDITADSLADHDILAAIDGAFPVLVADTGARADGITVTGLSDDDVARLDFYEGGYDYDLRQLTLASGQSAAVYVPTPGQHATDGRWDLDAWTRKWGEMTLYAAEEVMGYFGVLTPQSVASRYPRIRSRAWSRVLAQKSRHGAGTLRGQVEMVQRTRAYSGFFALDELRLRHETFDGGQSELLERGVFVSSDASIVLPYDPVRDRVLLVEQVRMGPIGRHDPVMWQMEPVAGLIDPGETPEETAHREAHEEAGLVFDRLEAAGACYASPGAVTDFFNLFVGLCALPDDTAGVAGEATEGENIRSHLMAFDDLLAMADACEVANVPLAMLTYWLAHHRARLRAGG
ncbi:MAG: NUDIX domain-containing protein [Pseudomonadota bacterium]